MNLNAPGCCLCLGLCRRKKGITPPLTDLLVFSGPTGLSSFMYPCFWVSQSFGCPPSPFGGTERPGLERTGFGTTLSVLQHHTCGKPPCAGVFYCSIKSPPVRLPVKINLGLSQVQRIPALRRSLGIVNNCLNVHGGCRRGHQRSCIHFHGQRNEDLS